MVSESVSWPVSMMIGALKPFLRRMRTASRPSMSGKPTSMITRSICPALAACTPLLPFSAATASYSSYSESCSVSAPRSSESSSIIRILRVFGIDSDIHSHSDPYDEAITQSGQYPLQRIGVGQRRDQSDPQRGDHADEDEQISNDFGDG